MRNKNVRRRIRLRLAPPGSWRDRWIKNISNFRNLTSQISLASFVAQFLPPFLKKILRERQHEKRRSRAVLFQKELREIISKYPGIERVFVFPPSLDWHTQLFQRPQQLALALARQGALVFYLQPEGPAEGEPFWAIQDAMYLCNLPMETFEVLEDPLVYVLTWNRNYASVFDSPKIVYDYVDEIEVFVGDHKQMYQDHLKLIQNAELVITTALRLYNQVSEQRRDAILCPNGVNYQHFASVRQSLITSPPPDMVSILETGKPVIGYYGALAIWFDYNLITESAKRRPDLFFVLIGPDYDGTLPPSMLDLQNVRWLGVKPYAELPRYLRYFDVATIPFKINHITHATSPLKLFEYMAAGKPTIITPMEESMRYAGVLVAKNADEFIEELDRGLKLKSDQEFLRLIDKVARENTWDNRAKQILAALS